MEMMMMIMMKMMVMVMMIVLVMVMVLVMMRAGQRARRYMLLCTGGRGDPCFCGLMPAAQNSRR